MCDRERERERDRAERERERERANATLSYNVWRANQNRTPMCSRASATFAAARAAAARSSGTRSAAANVGKLWARAFGVGWHRQDVT